MRNLGVRLCSVSFLSSPVSFSSQSSLFARSFSTAEKDLVVIGGGPGGYVAAIKAAQLGLSVTCVEKRGALGGTCLNVGCIPSKALLNSSHKYEDAKVNFKDYGITFSGDVSFDLEKIMKQKRDAVSGLTSGIENYLFKKNKVGYVKGHGTIVGPNEVLVDKLDGTKENIKAKNILIATGSEVLPVPGVQIDEERIVSSTGALSLKEVPKRLLVIGAGVIGLELGSVWRRLGSDVTVVEFTDRIAAGADSDIAKQFQKLLEKQKMKFKLGHKVTKAKVEGSVVKVQIEQSKGGEPQEVEVDYVLAAIGRRAYTDRLGLDSLGIPTDKAGRIEVDNCFRTKIPSIRAIGDCIRGPMLAHKAEDEGILCVEHIHNPKLEPHLNYSAVPSVIYTYPEVAWVGMTEDEAKQKGIKYRVGTFPFSANSRARTNAEPDGLVKYVSEEATDRILGVHMICGVAGEMIAEACLAIEYGASSEDIGRTCHAHPTLSEAVREAAMATYDKPIHI